MTLCAQPRAPSDFARAILRLFPPCPRDQYGPIAVANKSVDAQRMLNHALAFAGASATNSFVRGAVRHRPPPVDACTGTIPSAGDTADTTHVEAPHSFRSKGARAHGCVSVEVEHRAYMYPSVHIGGLRRLAVEMQTANKSLVQQMRHEASASARIHRKWTKGRWHVVDSNAEAQGLDLAGSKCASGCTSEMMWLPPKAVPLVHCAWTSGPALGVKWTQDEHFFHASQFAISDLPTYLKRSPRAYYGRTGCRIPLPYSAPPGGTPPPPNTVRCTADLKTMMGGTIVGPLPALTTCWFTDSDLKALGLAPLAGAVPTYFECVEHFVCVPLSNERFFDAEVRDTFLTAFPLPVPQSCGGAPVVYVFEAASRSWLSFPQSCCTLGMGEPLTETDRLFVDVLAADECGLMDWDPKTHREVLRFTMPPPSSPIQATIALDGTGTVPLRDHNDVPSEAHAIHDDAIEEEADDTVASSPGWGAARRRPLREAVASASHVLSQDVLMGLCSGATTDDARPEAPTSNPEQDGLFVAACEDIAGINVVHVRRCIAAYNAAHVSKSDHTNC